MRRSRARPPIRPTCEGGDRPSAHKPARAPLGAPRRRLADIVRSGTLSRRRPRTTGVRRASARPLTQPAPARRRSSASAVSAHSGVMGSGSSAGSASSTGWLAAKRASWAVRRSRRAAAPGSAAKALQEHLGPRHHLVRQPRQASHLDAVGAVGAGRAGPGAGTRSRRATRAPPRGRCGRRGELGGEPGQLVVVGREQTLAPAHRSWRYSATAQAMASPSKVDVPRPISSSRTRLRGVAWRRIAAVSASRP